MALIRSMRSWTRTAIEGSSLPSVVLRRAVRLLLLSATLINTALLGQAPHLDYLSSSVDRYMRTNSPGTVEVFIAHGHNAILNKVYVGGTPQERSLQLRPSVGAIGDQFLAAAILILHQKGLIEVFSPICNYLPTCPPGWQSIQVLHLMAHTSGLPLSQRVLSGYGAESTGAGEQERLAALAHEPPSGKPGSTFRDNPLDYVLLDLTIEKVTGRSAPEYIETELFDRLHMSNSRYSQSCVEVEAGDTTASRQQRHNCEVKLERAHERGTVESTAEDLFRWNSALLDGTILAPPLFAEMLTPFREGHALGWKIVKELGHRVALQFAKESNIDVSERLYPDDDLMVIIVAEHSPIGSSKIAQDIGSIMFGSGHAYKATIPPE